MFVSSAASPIVTNATPRTSAIHRTAGRRVRVGSREGSVIEQRSGWKRSCSPYPVADGGMTPNARQAMTLIIAVRDAVIDRRDDLFVTVPASAFRHLVIPRRDAKRIGVVAGREIEGMPEPVPRFRCVLTEERMRSVAIVAHRRLAMTGFHPRREVLVHDVTVRAGGGIVGEIRRTARIAEREQSKSDQDAEENRERRFGEHRHMRKRISCQPPGGNDCNGIGKSV